MESLHDSQQFQINTPKDYIRGWHGRKQMLSIKYKFIEHVSESGHLEGLDTFAIQSQATKETAPHAGIAES